MPYGWPQWQVGMGVLYNPPLEAPLSPISWDKNNVIQLLQTTICLELTWTVVYVVLVVNILHI